MAPFLAEGIARMPEARMSLLPFLGLGVEGLQRRDCFQLGALALTALTLSPPGGYRTLLHEGAAALRRGASPFPEGLRQLVARLLGLESPFASLAEAADAIDALAFDLDSAFDCGAVARAVYLRATHPEAYRLQARAWKWEARADWSTFLRVERLKGPSDAPEGGKGLGLRVGVTG
jgi:hypothetical protein